MKLFDLGNVMTAGVRFEGFTVLCMVHCSWSASDSGTPATFACVDEDGIDLQDYIHSVKPQET